MVAVPHLSQQAQARAGASNRVCLELLIFQECCSQLQQSLMCRETRRVTLLHTPAATAVCLLRAVAGAAAAVAVLSTWHSNLERLGAEGTCRHQDCVPPAALAALTVWLCGGQPGGRGTGVPAAGSAGRAWTRGAVTRWTAPACWARVSAAVVVQLTLRYAECAAGEGTQQGAWDAAAAGVCGGAGWSWSKGPEYCQERRASLETRCRREGQRQVAQRRCWATAPSRWQCLKRRP